ncbi:MAG: alpha/beta hydrolase [Candidatus Gracilibacteria bacterium]
MKFVLFHGAFGSPGSNWLPELKDKLESLGQEVVAPTFSVDTWDHITRLGQNVRSAKQNLNNWITEFDKIYKTFRKGEKLCFIGHSLGPLFILHLVERYNIKLDSAIFVCPFLEKLNKAWQIDHVNESFYKSDFDFGTLIKLIPISYVIYAKDDPYVPVKSARTFALNMKSHIIESETGMHFNSDAKCTSFPLVLELCKTRLQKGNTQNYFSVV